MIHYIIQVVAFQALFLLTYDLFLKKETFFNWNRLYLMGTAVLSFLLPFVQVSAIQQRVEATNIMQLPAIILGQSTPKTTAVLEAAPQFSWTLVWGLGMTIAVVWFAWKLYKIFKFKQLGTPTRFKAFTLITIANSSHAFSFLRTIFLGSDLSKNQRESVLQHEQVHVRQHHTLDQLFFEVLRIVFWFNPMVYMYQKRITSLHEYIADAQVAAQQGKSAYYQDLLSQVFQTQDVSFINPFFNHSLIKKRITMLQKSKSTKSKLLKFAMLLPLVAVMVFYASCSQEADQTAQQVEANAQTDVMTKIEELSEAIMVKGNITDEELKALQFLATPAKDGDKVYETVQGYLDDQSLHGEDSEYKVTEVQKLDVPFSVVDRVPVYSGCAGSNDELKSCMSQEISKFVAKQFNTKLASTLGLVGRQRISAQFKIDNTGNIVDVKARAPHPDLEAEAIRVIELIPRLQPGEHEGKTVAVLYSLPIIFQISE